MKVVFMPDNGDTPYQELLKGRLAELGVKVCPALRPPVFQGLASVLRFRPEVLHLHWTSPYLLGRNTAVSLVKSTLFCLDLFLCRLAGVRLVWTLHNLHNHEKYQYGLELFFNRVIARLADALVAHCEAHRAEAAVLYELRDTGKIRVIEQGNYASWYPNTSGRAEARARFGLAPSDRVFVFLGNIRAYKGVLELIGAFSGLPGENLRLLIAGKPFDRAAEEEVRAASAGDGRIRLFTGFVPDGEVQYYMNAADAAVLPYREITTSAALLLALSFGKPVVAPALPYLAWALGPCGGLTYDPAAPGALRAALEKALAADLEAEGRRASARAAEFTWEAAAGATLELYRSLLL